MHVVPSIDDPLIRIIGCISLTDHKSSSSPKFVRSPVHVFVKGTKKCWKLANGSKIRFHKHGTIKVDWALTYAPYISITLPRKKWNPKGTETHVVPVPVGPCELAIAHDKMCYRPMPAHEYDAIVGIIQEQSALHPPGTKPPR